MEPSSPAPEESVVLLGGETTTPGPDLGLVNYTHSRLRNPGFEDWVTEIDADDWVENPNGAVYHWAATTPAPPQGTYSYGFECRDPFGLYNSRARFNQYNIWADMRALNLTFDWYLDQNLHPASGENYFRLYIILDDAGLQYRMYYYLNGTTSSTNSSNSGYFLLDGLEQQWNRFSRNITDDFLAVPSFPSTISSTLQFRSIYFQIETRNGFTEYLRAFVDDVWLENDTTTWIGGATLNGNMESVSGTDPTVWSRYSNDDPGYISRSPFAHSGSWSVNCTAASLGNSSEAYFGEDPDVRVSSENPAHLQFWWHLNYQQASSVSWSYFAVDIYNGTSWMEIYYWLGYGGTSCPYMNTTFNLNYLVDGFNTTDTWIYFDRDIWADASAWFNGNVGFFIGYVEFDTVEFGSAGSVVTTLIDDARFVSHSINGAGFEDQQATGAQVRGWDYYGDPDFTVTSTAYGGSKAANMTLSPGNTMSVQQYIKDRDLNGTRETYLDVMWRLQDYLNFYARMEVHLADEKHMYYYFVTTSLPTSGGDYAYFNVSGSGTMNTWMQMHRDLCHDYEEAFGSLPDTFIDSIVLYGYNIGGGRMELLLDDLYLYDDPAPRISNVDHTPTSPESDDPANVSCDAEDQDLDKVMLYYRTNGGGWQHLQMPESASYDQDIPGQPYGTVVQYYVTANDTWGMTSTDDNGGSYYGYTVDDTVDPTISSLSNTPSSPQYTDSVLVNCTALDPGSGIASVQLSYRIDSGTWTPLPMPEDAPDEYEATIPVQAWYTLVEYYVTATDVAGNPKVDDNGGGYYWYRVGDSINPIVSVSAPADEAVVTGTVQVTATANDPGSGIERVDFLITSADAEASDSDNTAPYTFSWDTTLVPNGEYTITVTAYDNVGNTATDSITVTLNNLAAPPPIPGFPLGAIILALVTSIGYSVLRRRRYRP